MRTKEAQTVAEHALKEAMTKSDEISKELSEYKDDNASLKTELAAAVAESLALKNEAKMTTSVSSPRLPELHALY